MKKLFSVLFVFVLSVIGVSAQSYSRESGLIENVRGLRYCEIIVVKGRFRNLKATVYTTMGKNDCPADRWNAIDFDKLKRELGARATVKNGPRYFLMDKISATHDSPRVTKSFNGLEMWDAATLKVKKKSEPYSERTVNRSTVFVFDKGKTTYQLVGPNATYVMQSFSQILDPNLSEADLAGLATRLKLPPGWQFKAVKLESDLKLSTLESGKATVIQDNLSNTYQRID